MSCYKGMEDIPVTFGVPELAKILGISRNKAYELVNRPGFPKFRMGRRVIISKRHFSDWMDANFLDTSGN